MGFVFRFDAGARAGAGHFMRQLAVAERAARRAPATMLVPADAAGLAGAIGPDIERVELPALPWPEELAWLRARFGGRIAFVDSYALPMDYYQRLSEGGFVVGFEDGGRALPVPLVVKPRPRDPDVACDAGVLEGCEYVPVRGDFVRAAATPRPTEEPRHLVICFGASDPTGATARVLRWLPAVAAPRWRVTVVRGPLSAEATTAALPVEGLRALGWHIDVARAPDMAALLASADAAVVAAGTILWELAASAVPTLACAVVDNQRRNAEILHRQGCIAGGGFLCDDSMPALGRELAAFLADDARRRKLAARLGALVDGRGAERIVDAAIKGHEAHERGVR